jgi:hypothetical protein
MWQHTLERCKGAINDAEISNFCYALDLCRFHFAHRREYGNHGIVDPDIDGPESFFHNLGCVFDSYGIRNVGLDNDCCAPS